jgi:hypothetical protein
MTLAVSTGLDSFQNPQDIGPMYPFVGEEWLFVVIAVIVWIGWHVLQIRGESREETEAVEMYDRIGLDRAMFHGGSALIATDDEWAEHRRAEAANPAEPPPPH